jgi:hypothetical protein
LSQIVACSSGGRFVLHRCFVFEESSFADKKQVRPDPLETSIASELWRWAFSPTEARAEIIRPQSELAGAVEWWLCGALEPVPFTRSRGIWCDGVIDLSIERVNRKGFKINTV